MNPWLESKVQGVHVWIRPNSWISRQIPGTTQITSAFIDGERFRWAAFVKIVTSSCNSWNAGANNHCVLMCHVTSYCFKRLINQLLIGRLLDHSLFWRFHLWFLSTPWLPRLPLAVRYLYHHEKSSSPSIPPQSSEKVLERWTLWHLLLLVRLAFDKWGENLPVLWIDRFQFLYQIQNKLQR